MAGLTYREACTLQSVLLRQRAKQIAGRSGEAMPMDELVRMLVELHDVQDQLRQLDDFLVLLDSAATSETSMLVGSPS